MESKYIDTNGKNVWKDTQNALTSLWFLRVRFDELSIKTKVT